MTMHILYLCHRIPYPPNKGDKIRSFNEIRYLAREHTVDLVTLVDDPADLVYAQDLEIYCRTVRVFLLNKKTALIKGTLSLVSGSSITQGYFYKRAFQKAVDTLTASTRYDMLICFSSPMARYVFQAAKKPLDLARTLIMDFCDLDSDKWLQYATKKPFPVNLLYRLEGARLLAFEKQINRSFHTSVFVSQKEADLFVRVFPGAADIAVIPNGVDHQYFTPGTDPVPGSDTGPDPGPDDTPDPGPDHTPDHTPDNKAHADRPVIAFFGAMDYYANVDGACWFARQILPAVRQKIPEVLFYVVGSRPAPELTALAAADAGIRVTGFVEDIRPWYTRARVCVIPLRIARGVQNKVLEAMSMEKAIVTTSPAVQGISLPHDPPLAVTDDPDRFAAHVTALLQDAPRRRAMGRAARQHIKEHFNWDRNMKALVSGAGQ